MIDYNAIDIHWIEKVSKANRKADMTLVERCSCASDRNAGRHCQEARFCSGGATGTQRCGQGA